MLGVSLHAPLLAQSTPESGAVFPFGKVSVSPADGIIVPSEQNSTNIVRSGSDTFGRRQTPRTAARTLRATSRPDLCFQPGVGWEKLNSDAAAAIAPSIAEGSTAANGFSIPSGARAYKTMTKANSALCPQDLVTARAAGKDVSNSIEAPGDTSSTEVTAAGFQEDQGDQEDEIGRKGRGKYPGSLQVRGSTASPLTTFSNMQFGSSSLALKDFGLQQQAGNIGRPRQLAGSGTGRSTRAGQDPGCIADSNANRSRSGLFSDVRHRCPPSKSSSRKEGASRPKNWLETSVF